MSKTIKQHLKDTYISLLKYFLLVILAGLIVGGLGCEEILEKGTISGNVSDNSTPINGALVMLLDEGEILTSGLWAYSRHPNYFGEVLFWWGLYLFALTAAPSYWWTVAGPVLITLLFIFISVPLIEKHMKKRKPDYAVKRQGVSAWIPWFPGPSGPATCTIATSRCSTGSTWAAWSRCR